MATTKKRQKELERQRYERRLERAAANRIRNRRRQQYLAAGAGVAVVLGGVGYLGYGQYQAGVAADACVFTAEGSAARKVAVPEASRSDATAFNATLRTNRGEVTFVADPKAPCSSQSFRHLAEANYFDNTPCHRLTSGGLQVLQCGDPTGQGTGGPGYRFANENTAGATYRAGTVAMAHSSQPDSNGSQFFLVYGDSQLPPEYTVLGRVTKGLDVLRNIGKAGNDGSNGPGDGKPKQPVTLTSVSITG